MVSATPSAFDTRSSNRRNALLGSSILHYTTWFQQFGMWEQCAASRTMPEIIFILGIILETLQTLSFSIGPVFHFNVEVIKQLTFAVFSTIVPIWDTEDYGPVNYIVYSVFVYVMAAACIATVAFAGLLMGRRLQDSMLEANAAVGIATQCLSSWLYLPFLHLFLAGLGCENNANKLKGRAPHVLHFPDEHCRSGFHITTMVISIVGLVALFMIGGLMSTMMGDVRLGAFHLRSRPHNQIEGVHFLILTSLAVAFHLLLPYGRQDVYSCLVIVGMLLTTALHSYGLPFYRHSMNIIRTTTACATLLAAAINLATALWDSGLGKQGEFEAAGLNSQLLAALLPLGVLLGYSIGDLRPCNELRGKLKTLLQTGMVPRHEALFPFPRSKLTHDLKFTSARYQTLEAEILTEYEDVITLSAMGTGMQQQSSSLYGEGGSADSPITNNFSPSSPASPIGMGSHVGGGGAAGAGGVEGPPNSSRPTAAVPSITDFDIDARAYRVATHCQIVVPYVKQVRIPWDCELSTRFVKMQSDLTALPASPFVVAFASRIFIKCLLLWRTSGLIKCAFANFLFARTKRFRLALDIIEEVDGQVDCDHDLMTLYISHKIGHEIRDLSGIRDEIRTLALHRARFSHKEALLEMSHFWTRLLDSRGDTVGLSLVCAQINNRRENAQMEYERFLLTQRPDGVVLSMYASFLEHVVGDDMATEEFKSLAVVAAEEKRQRILRRGGQSTVSVGSDSSTARATAKLIENIHDDKESDRKIHDEAFTSTISAKSLMKFLIIFLIVVALTSIIGFALQRVKISHEAEAVRQVRRVGEVRSSVEKQRFLVMKANEEKLQCFINTVENARSSGTTAAQSNTPLLNQLVTSTTSDEAGTYYGGSFSTATGTGGSSTSSLLLCSEPNFLRAVKALSDEEVRMRGTFNMATIGKSSDTSGASVGRLAMQAATQRSVPLRTPFYGEVFSVPPTPFVVADAPGLAATVIRTGTFSLFSQSAANAVAVTAESPWISITMLSQKVTDTVNGMVAGAVYGDSFGWVASADNLKYIVDGLSAFIRGQVDDVVFESNAYFGAILGLFLLAVLFVGITYFALLANVQRAALDQMNRLQLFSLVPYNTQEELCLRVKNALEVFERMGVDGGDGLDSDLYGGGTASSLGTSMMEDEADSPSKGYSPIDEDGDGRRRGGASGFATTRANAVVGHDLLVAPSGQDAWGGPATPTGHGNHRHGFSTNQATTATSQPPPNLLSTTASRKGSAAGLSSTLPRMRILQPSPQPKAAGSELKPTVNPLLPPSHQRQQRQSLLSVTDRWVRATTAAGVGLASNDPDGSLHINVTSNENIGGPPTTISMPSSPAVADEKGTRRLRMFQPSSAGIGMGAPRASILGNGGSGGSIPKQPPILTTHRLSQPFATSVHGAAQTASTVSQIPAVAMSKSTNHHNTPTHHVAPFGNIRPPKTILKRPTPTAGRMAPTYGTIAVPLSALQHGFNPFPPYVTANNPYSGGDVFGGGVGVHSTALHPPTLTQSKRHGGTPPPQPTKKRVQLRIEGEGIVLPGGKSETPQKRPPKRLKEKKEPIPEDIVAEFESSLRQAQREADEENERERVRSEKVIFGGLRAYQMGRKRALEIIRQASEKSYWDVSSLSLWIRVCIIIPIIISLLTCGCGLSIASEVWERNVESVRVAAAASDLVSQLRQIRMETIYFVNSGRIEHYQAFMTKLQNREFFTGPQRALSSAKVINADTASHIVNMQRVSERIIYDLVVAMAIGGRAIATSSAAENTRRGLVDVEMTDVPVIGGVSWISSGIDEKFAKMLPQAVTDPLAYAIPSLALLRNNHIAYRREKAYYEDLIRQWTYNNTFGTNNTNGTMPVFKTRFRTLNQILQMSVAAQANRSKASRFNNVFEVNNKSSSLSSYIDDSSVLVDGAVIAYLNVTNLVVEDTEELLTFAKLRITSKKIDDDFDQIERALTELLRHHGFMRRYESSRKIRTSTITNPLLSTDSITANVETAYVRYSIAAGLSLAPTISNSLSANAASGFSFSSAAASAALSTAVNGGIMANRYGVGDEAIVENFGSVELPGIISVGSDAYKTAQSLLIVGFAFACLALGIVAVTLLVSIARQARRCHLIGEIRLPSAIETSYLVFLTIALILICVSVALMGNTLPVFFSVNYVQDDVVKSLQAYEATEKRFFDLYVTSPAAVLTAPLVISSATPLHFYELYQQRPSVGTRGTAPTTLKPVAGNGMLPWLSELANALDNIAENTNGEQIVSKEAASGFREGIYTSVLPSLATLSRIQDVGLYIKRCADLKFAAEDAILKNMTARSTFNVTNPPPVTIAPLPSPPFILDYNMATEPSASQDLSRFSDFPQFRYTSPSIDIPPRSSGDLVVMARAAVFGSRGLFYMRNALNTIRDTVFVSMLIPGTEGVAHRAHRTVKDLTIVCGLLASSVVVSVVLFVIPWAIYLFSTRKGIAKAAGLLNALFRETLRNCRIALSVLVIVVAVQFTLFFLADGIGEDSSAIIDNAFMRETLVAQCYADAINLKFSAHNGNVFEAAARSARLSKNAEQLKVLRNLLYYQDGALSGRYGRTRPLSDVQKKITFDYPNPLDRLMSGWIDLVSALGASSNRIVPATTENNITRLARNLVSVKTPDTNSRSGSSTNAIVVGGGVSGVGGSVGGLVTANTTLAPSCSDLLGSPNFSAYASCYPSVPNNYSHITSPTFLTPYIHEDLYLDTIDAYVSAMSAAIGPLFTALRKSNNAFTGDVEKAIDNTLAPDIIMLIAVLVLIAAELQVVFRPVGDLLVAQETGARLLLTMIPPAVRDLVPRIQQYLDTGDLSDESFDSEAHEQSRDAIERFKAMWQDGETEDMCFSALNNDEEHGLVVISSDGTVRHVNNALGTILGYNRENIVGLNVSEMMDEPMRANHDSYIKRYLTQGTPRVIGSGRDTVAVTRQGQRIPIFLQIFDAVRDDGEMYFLGQIDRYIGTAGKMQR